MFLHMIQEYLRNESNALSIIAETKFGRLYSLRMAFYGLFETSLKSLGSQLSTDPKKSKIGLNMTELQTNT